MTTRSLLLTLDWHFYSYVRSASLCVPFPASLQQGKALKTATVCFTARLWSTTPTGNVTEIKCDSHAPRKQFRVCQHAAWGRTNRSNIPGANALRQHGGIAVYIYLTAISTMRQYDGFIYTLTGRLPSTSTARRLYPESKSSVSRLTFRDCH